MKPDRPWLRLSLKQIKEWMDQLGIPKAQQRIGIDAIIQAKKNQRRQR